MDLYEKAQDYCRKQGTTINKLEKSLGWSRGSIKSMSTARYTDTERFYTLAEVMGVSREYLLHGDTFYENEESGKIAQTLLDRPDLKVLFDAVADVPPEDVEFVREMIERCKRG